MLGCRPPPDRPHRGRPGSQRPHTGLSRPSVVFQSCACIAGSPTSGRPGADARPRLRCGRLFQWGRDLALHDVPVEAGAPRGSPGLPCIPRHRLHDSRGVRRDVLLRELRRLLGQGVCTLVPRQVTVCRYPLQVGPHACVRHSMTSSSARSLPGMPQWW